MVKVLYTTKLVAFTADSNTPERKAPKHCSPF